MGNILSKTFATIAIASAAVGIPANWTQQHVVNENGFVGLVNQLGENKDFQQSISKTASETAVNNMQIPDMFKSMAQPAIDGAVSSVTQDPNFSKAWSDSAHLSHTEFFATDQSNNEQPGQLSFDVGPMAKLVAGNVSSSTGFDVPVPDSMPIDLGNFDTKPIAKNITTFGDAGKWLLGASGISALLALLVSNNRGRTLRNMSLSMLGAVIVLKLVTMGAMPLIFKGQNPSAVAQELLGSVKNVVTGSFDADLIKWGIGSIVGYFVGVVWGGASRGKRKE